MCDSDDHVFPKFVGGRTAVAVCTNCNSTFGHTFEAATAKAKHLRNWMFLLWRCGMRPPTPIVWKEIIKDESGRLYDVDQDFKASLSKPEIHGRNLDEFSALLGIRTAYDLLLDRSRARATTCASKGGIGVNRRATARAHSTHRRRCQKAVRQDEHRGLETTRPRATAGQRRKDLPLGWHHFCGVSGADRP